MLSARTGDDAPVVSSADPIDWVSEGRLEEVADMEATALVDSLSMDRDAGLEAVDLETVDDNNAGFFPESSCAEGEFPFIIASITES